MARKTMDLAGEVARWMGRCTRTPSGCLMGPQLGYGGISYSGGQRISAHRAVYLIHNGPIAPGMVIRHTCDRIGCVEPAHLIIGTPADNMRDKVERGRQPAGDDHPHARDRSAVETARRLYSGGDLTKRQVAQQLGIPLATVDKWTKGTVRQLAPLRIRDGRFKPTGQGCGTRAGYARHQASGEPACGPCRKACRDYARAYRAARREWVDL